MYIKDGMIVYIKYNKGCAIRLVMKDTEYGDPECFMVVPGIVGEFQLYARDRSKQGSRVTVTVICE